MPARTNPLTARFGVAHALVRAASTLVSTPVLHLFKFFAAPHDFGAARVRRAKENSPARQRWEWVKDTRSPGTGRKSFYSGASFAPFRGWSIGYGNPRLTPWAMLFRPPGLVLWLRLRRSVGRAILPAAAFQAALWPGLLILAPGHRRLRPGTSQDRLPPSSNTGILARFSRQVSSLGARSSRKLVRNAG